MYFLESFKTELAQAINTTLPRPLISGSDFVLPPKADLGDLSLPCFTAAKALQTNPVMLAQKIATSFKQPTVEKVEAVGPYLNITFRTEIISNILEEIFKKGDEYGKNTSGEQKRVMLEYANGNTHKEYHVGHLRNIAFGDAVNRILRANGYTSLPVSYINDFGIHVAKTLWYFKKMQQPIPREIQEGVRTYGWWLGMWYQQAVSYLDDHPEEKIEVAETMKAIESRSGDTYTLWQETRQWSLDQMEKINQELGVEFETTFYESDYIDEGFKIVKELVDKGILIKSEGAIIANLENHNLGILVVVRSDGTALYPVADLSLTIHKVKKYKLDTSLWVVDIRQGQYLHQLFKVLELYGLKAHLEHLPYEFVTLPSGMMSSRSGNVVTYEELKAEALKRTREEIVKRHHDWEKTKIEKVASVLAFGALKFEMIKVSGDKVITFDMDRALRFDGFTAAYLQYTYARIQSLSSKASEQWSTIKADFSFLDHPREKQLALKLGQFSHIVALAVAVYQPSELARYVYELAQLFNEYYHIVPILNDETLDPNLGKARLDLALATALIIKNSLDLLGIEVVETM